LLFLTSQRTKRIPTHNREEAGELLWDMTAVAEHASFLTAHLLPEALGTLLSNPKTPDRLREIALGSLANLMCHPAVGLALCAHSQNTLS
jgi:hypothetical protein